MAEPTTRTPTHYDILGVRPTASPQQIRRAFRDLSKLYHPDTTELPEAEATAKFQQLNEAYAILSSPDRRWTYDKQVGYSRISVMQPLEPLSRSQTIPRRKEVSNLYLDPNDRPLSAGEIFALFILGLTFLACLALVLTIGFTRGETALFFPDEFTPEIVESVLPDPLTDLSAPGNLPDPATPEDPFPLAQTPEDLAGAAPDAPPPLTEREGLPRPPSSTSPAVGSTWL